MKRISINLILLVLISSLGCQQSYITKKEDECLLHLDRDNGFLYRASRDVEEAKYINLYDKHAIFNNTLYHSTLIITSYPWHRLERLNIPIKNIYSIHTPRIDSFLSGTIVAASSALIINQGLYKDIYIPISNF